MSALTNTRPASEDTPVVKIAVRVDDKLKKPVCTPDPVTITAPSVLQFDLQTAGYSFPEHCAVVVKSTSKDFPAPPVTVSSTRVTLQDLDTEKGSFKYTIYLCPEGGGEKIQHDPTITNEPE